MPRWAGRPANGWGPCWLAQAPGEAQRAWVIADLALPTELQADIKGRAWSTVVGSGD